MFDLARRLMLRLPPEVMTELRRWSEQELRSLNGHIEWLLRDALRRRGQEPAERAPEPPQPPDGK